MSVPTFHPTPNVEKGVKYWQGVPATVDGVLGGYGNGTLPIVDAQGSRTFLLDVLPRLSAIPPASSSSKGSEAWLEERMAERGGGVGGAKTRALDCGAGVGRVTRDVLSRIVDVVHIVEPVDNFLAEAKKRSPSWPAMQTPASKTAFKARKAVHFHLCTLQSFDPARPYSTASKEQRYEPTLAVADEGAKGDDGSAQPEAASKDEPMEYDVVWGQWCLQHLSDKDLLAFFERCKACLKKANKEVPSSANAVLDGAGVIVVKENVLRETDDGSERVWYDDEDHSITRTPNAYERIFREANLEVVRTEVQLGLPEELFPVQMWCLRIPYKVRS